MHEDRFPFSQSAYEQKDIEAQFRLYEGLGHSLPQIRDLIEFHRRAIAGEDVSDFGADVASGAAGPVVTEGPTAAVTLDTEDVVVGDSVSFDASESQRGDTVIAAYSWEFGDGSTGSGESVTHAFEESGEYTVELTVEDFYGETATAKQELTVAEPATPTPTQTPTPDTAMTPTPEASGGTGGDTPTETESSSGGEETPGGSGPGFGVGTTITALGSGAYVLARRLAASEE